MNGERIARLLGWSKPMDGEDHPYAFATDANLSRELLAFVRKRGNQNFRG